jgi:uncharacterized membrane protein (DUF4010 family)
MHFSELYLFLISILIGALIGTERQRRLVEARIRGVAGLRTFILISILGTLCATMAELYGQIFMVVAFGAFILMVAVGYAVPAKVPGRPERVDFTSAVAAVVTFILGALCYFEEDIILPVSLAVLTTTVLAIRRTSHRYVEMLSDTDLLDSLKMGIIALVIYPILPDRTLDPFDVLNPRQIWLMVVMVSLISYSGYVLIRLLGAERGLNLMGFLGGLASSTAVTTSMAAGVRQNRAIISSAALATVVASCTMFARVLFIVLLVNKDLIDHLLPQLASMIIAGLALAYFLHRGSAHDGNDVEIKDPFRIGPALKFGAFFAVVLVVSKLASIYFGDVGTYAASLIAGLADVDAITLSMATLAKTTLSQDIAVNSITLALMTNTLVKLSISYILGTREFGNRIAMVFLPTICVGLLAIAIF